MLLPDPTPPRSTTRFSGWRIVALSAIALGMTGPGQTAGVSVFVDPMMASLELTRSQVSTAYLVGTLAGALAMPRVGRLIDDRGSRFAMALVGGLFGVVLAAMAGVVGLVTLVVGFTGIRMLGQGGLSLVATTAPAPWFRRRRGLAIGVLGAVGGALLSLVPVVSAWLIGHTGWRTAWLVAAVAVWVVVLPIAVRGLIDRPADVGQRVDGRRAPVEPDTSPDTSAGTSGSKAMRQSPGEASADAAGDTEAVEASYTRGQALRTPMFWAVTGGVAVTGMIGTGLAFHQISLLGEQGLTPVQAAANFLPQTVAALVATLLIGTMVDRFAPGFVLLASMSSLIAAMVAVPFVEPGVSAMLYGMAIGAAGSSVRALEAASFPKLFGVRHIGSIRGVVTSVSVASTAFGPLALSVGFDLTGSYVEVLRILLVAPVAVAVFGLLSRVPERPTP